jgi:hypothetical protein
VSTINLQASRPFVSHFISPSPALRKPANRPGRPTTPAAAAPEALAVMQERRSQGAAFREIARRLNRLNIRPGRGREWHGTSVKGQLAANQA